MTNHPLIISCFAILCSLFVTSCGGDSSSSSQNPETIENKTISGVAQIGPFEKGATVAVYELDEDFQRTVFYLETKTKNNLGEFSLNVKDFDSQYALFKANGRYLNAISGKRTSNDITLYAISDLSNHDEVNINILTHLSYKRALHLVAGKKIPLSKAQQQAETEVLKSFGIDEKIDETENLNIFGENEQNAALLAISVLMQADIDEEKIEDRLTAFANDIEKDGIWNDIKTATKLADWASKRSMDTSLTKIRDNIEKWDLSVTIPDFEKYVNSFWWKNYGLPNCTGKNKNQTLKNENIQSIFENKYLICRPPVWRIADYYEIEKYFVPDSTSDSSKSHTPKDADFRWADSDQLKCEVYEDGLWRLGNRSDCNYGFRGCTKQRQHDIRQSSNGTWYVCDHRKWIDTSLCKSVLGCSMATDVANLGWNSSIKNPKDTSGWKDTTDGAIRKGNKSDIIYIYDINGWRVATLPEASLGGCTKDNLDSIGFAKKREGQIDSLRSSYPLQEYSEILKDLYKEGYYRCSLDNSYLYSNNTNSDSYYTYKWVYTNECIQDWLSLKKGKEGDTHWGNECKGKCYAFKNGQWNYGSAITCLGWQECTEKHLGTIKQGPFIQTSKKCPYKDDYFDYHIDCDIKIASVDSSKKTWYICRDYYSANELHDLLDITQNPWGGFFWDYATDMEVNPSKYECSKDGTIITDKTIPTIKYVCDEDGFRKIEKIEERLELGCTSYTQNKYTLLSDSKSYFKCSKDAWHPDDIRDTHSYFWEFAKEKNQGTMTDPRDSSVYKTLNLGKSTWMVENLNYADSANYPSMLNRNGCENDKPANCKKNGRLYTWSAIIDSVYWASKGQTCGTVSESKKKCELPEKVQGICPEGWHIPSIKEWQDLASWEEQFYVSYENSGFVPSIYTNRNFWTSEFADSSSYINHIGSYKPKSDLLSVRCVKDN